VQPMFIHQRFDLRQFDYLMLYGVRIVAGQGPPASTALSRTVIVYTPTRFDRIEFSLISFVTGLSTTFPATRGAWLPGWRTRSITRWRLRYSARGMPCLFPEPLILGVQAADFPSSAANRSSTCNNACWTLDGVSTHSSGVILMLEKVSSSESIGLRLPNQVLFCMLPFLPP
jgi:hypothetical protein